MTYLSDLIRSARDLERQDRCDEQDRLVSRYGLPPRLADRCVECEHRSSLHVNGRGRCVSAFCPCDGWVGEKAP